MHSDWTRRTEHPINRAASFVPISSSSTICRPSGSTSTARLPGGICISREAPGLAAPGLTLEGAGALMCYPWPQLQPQALPVLLPTIIALGPLSAR